MANISQFHGEITFPMECANELIAFLDNYTSPNFYGVMYFNKCGNDIRKDIENNMLPTVGFSGDGRWTASSMFDEDGSLFFFPQENPYARLLIGKLVGRSLPIDYIDYEPGCDVLYEFIGEMRVDIFECVKILGDYEAIESTSRNLIQYDCESCAIDGSVDKDFEKLVNHVAQELDFDDDIALLRLVIRDTLNNSRYDGMLTDMDLEYWFVEDVSFALKQGERGSNVYALPKQCLINFL